MSGTRALTVARVVVVAALIAPGCGGREVTASPLGEESGDSGLRLTGSDAPAQDPGVVVDSGSIDDFLALTPQEIAAASELRVLFIDHSVGANISDGLDCTAFPSIAAAPNRCTRFDHITPELSADPGLFRFGVEYDRSAWRYHAGAPSYWREWSDHVAELLGPDPDWDVVIPMPSYLVGPNGGWQPLDGLEASYPEVVFVYATTSLPRGVQGGTDADRVMELFNSDARAYALAHGKPLLDVADILSHDYTRAPCYDARDGVQYCQAPGRCEDLPDDGAEIPAICQHYTTELFGGHLGSVSGGALRMAQAMWVLMHRLAGGERPTPLPSATPPGATATATPIDGTPQPGATASPTAHHGTPPDPPRLFLPLVGSDFTGGVD